MRPQLLLFLLTLLLPHLLPGQNDAQNRLEFETDERITGDAITSFGDDGLVITSRDDDPDGGDYTWHYRKYDTDLKLINEEELHLDQRMRSDEEYRSGDNLYSLFKSRYGNYLFSTLNVGTFKMTNHEGELPKRTETHDMVVLGNYAFLSAQTKRESYLLALNVETSRTKVIPVNFGDYKSKDVTIINTQLVEESREVFVFARLRDNKRSSEIYVVRLDDQGNRIGESVLTRSLDENIVSVSANYRSPGVYTFVGTYSTRSASASEGLFYCQTTNDRVDFFKTTNFLDLQDFLSYLPEKKQEKIERRKDRKAEAGKELKINYQIASHNIIELEDGFLSLGEAYYPTYRSETYTSYSTVNGVSVPSTSTTQVFDGYRYTHAVLCKYDKQGNLLWDRSFKMYPARKPFYVKKFISLVPTDEAAIKMIFASGTTIVTKAVASNGNILLDFETEDIDTGNEADKVKRAWSNLEYWYGDYFYAFGYQKIKNKGDKDVDKKRKVYFLNKVQF